MANTTVRIGIDVGGTFTDFALATPGGIKTLKLPTTEDKPERAILDGVSRLLKKNNITPDQVESIVHGTTLATNAIISRTGTRTALLTTAGFRDVLALGDESRFDQYDVNIVKPEPLVPRWWRFGIEERISARGDVLLPLDEEALEKITGRLEDEQIESVAVCFLHAHVNASHEKRACERLAELLPSLSICMSSEVSPEIGEYGRFSTTAANAYVQPVMAAYLDQLEKGLHKLGLTAPVFMFLSNGGLCKLDTAKKFPIRLVESGPAGGAVFAGGIARDLEEEEILAFDMGGTTAKVCLIDHGVPRRSDYFEMAREHMHRQGSGLPARIPVIDLVEIGAGGGSIAHIDSMSRLRVGPESAGATPGPACYSRGGEQATVTDADLLLGRLAPEDFQGSGIAISLEKARRSIGEQVGDRLELEDVAGAMAISEIVEEQMASAAREHAREKGVDLRQRSMVAFGGAAPLHAASVAAKLGIDRIIIPEAAGIGSAVGFLQSQAVFEISRSIKMPLEAFDAALFNREFAAIAVEARSVVAAAAPDAELEESRTVAMRYRGQGHSLKIAIEARELIPDDGATLLDLFLQNYISIYHRPLDGIEVECVGLGLRASSVGEALPVKNILVSDVRKTPVSMALFDLDENGYLDVPAINRTGMTAGQSFTGPGLIKDDGTTICVPKNFSAVCFEDGPIIITRQTALEKG
jgi:N-methylhydantoinase A